LSKLYIDAIYRGQGVDQGLKQTKSNLDGLKEAAQAAFGAFSVSMAVNELKRLYEGLLDDREATHLLTGQLRRLGQSDQDIKKVTREIGNMRDALGVGDTELTRAYARLITMTGNARTATDDLTLALDLQAAQVGDLNTAIRLIGQARAGEYMMLMRSIPQMRSVAEEYRGIGRSAEATEAVLGKLRTEFGGMAEEMASTQAGQIRRLKTAMGELAEEALRFWEIMLGMQGGDAGGLADVYNKVREGLYGINVAILSINRSVTNKLPDWLNEAREVLSGNFPWFVGLRPPPRRETSSREVPVSIPDRPSSMDRPGVQMGAESLGFDAITSEMDAALEAQRRQWQETIPKLIVPDDTDWIVDQYGQIFEEIEEEVNPHLNQMTTALASDIEGAFYAAFDGVDALGEYMKKILIQQVVGELARALAGALTGGTAGGGGWLAGLLGGGDKSLGGAYQGSAASAKNMAWRQVRG